MGYRLVDVKPLFEPMLDCLLFGPGPLGTNFNEILIDIHSFPFQEMHSKLSSEKMVVILCRPQCVWQYDAVSNVRLNGETI